MRSYKSYNWDTAQVRCPFYMKHDKEQRQLRCEGCLENSALINAFRSVPQMGRHMGLYCAGRYEDCPVYMGIYAAKYND